MHALLSNTPVSARQRIPARAGRIMLWAGVLILLAWVLATRDVRLIVVAALLAGGTFSALRFPWLVWGAVGAVLPFAAAVKFGMFSVLDGALIAAFALWFVDGVRRRSLRIDASVPALLGVVYSAVLVLASLGARDLPQSVAEVIKWLQFAAVIAILPAVVSRSGVRWVALGLLAGASAQAALGLYQFVFRIGPEWFVVLGRFMRASGSFAQPNPFAGYLGLMLPVAVSLAINALADLWNRPQAWHRWLWAGCYAVASVLIAAALLASWSRGGWIAAALAGVVVIALRSKRAAILAGVGAVLVGLLLTVGTLSPTLLPAPVAERLDAIPAYFGSSEMLQQEVDDDNFAVIERLAHWEAAKRMFALSPWLGVGPGNYAAVYDDVRLPLWREPLGHAHNYYLNTLAESGVVGFGAFLVLWGITAVWLLKRIAVARSGQYFDGNGLDAYGAALSIGVVGALVHLAAHNLVDNLFVQGIYVQVALWIALVQARTKLAAGTEQFSQKQLAVQRRSESTVL